MIFSHVKILFLLISKWHELLLLNKNEPASYINLCCPISTCPENLRFGLTGSQAGLHANFAERREILNKNLRQMYW